MVDATLALLELHAEGLLHLVQDHTVGSSLSILIVTNLWCKSHTNEMSAWEAFEGSNSGNGESRSFCGRQSSQMKQVAKQRRCVFGSCIHQGLSCCRQTDIQVKRLNGLCKNIEGHHLDPTRQPISIVRETKVSVIQSQSNVQQRETRGFPMGGERKRRRFESRFVRLEAVEASG